MAILRKCDACGNEIPDLCPLHQIELVRQFLRRLERNQIERRRAAGESL